MGGTHRDGPVKRRPKAEPATPAPPQYTAQQDRAMEALLDPERGTVAQAAQAAGVAVSTVYSWLRPTVDADGRQVQTPFAQRYHDARDQALQEARDRLALLTSTAVTALASAMRNPHRDSMAVVKGAAEALDRAGIVAPQAVTVTLTGAESASDEDLDAAIEAEMRRKGWRPPDEPR